MNMSSREHELMRVHEVTRTRVTSIKHTEFEPDIELDIENPYSFYRIIWCTPLTELFEI